uniref:Light-independent protochlorophyllide reductase subunit B n=1 Tax=Marvania geminata TaxID=97105 RepID=A0A097KR37_9CHLO|nr:ChlB subunit of protochlorophyllide reductase [Marvania geminata]AIT95647.1 ChlB subunit of protochlorophyllide reductase [Marvania geminata]
MHAAYDWGRRRSMIAYFKTKIFYKRCKIFLHSPRFIHSGKLVLTKNIYKFNLYMKLAYWMYAGPAHIGTLRVASSFKNVHAIMHAPLGDDYFNVMRSMLERERDFTPVTASIVDRHVLARGSQEKVVENIRRKDSEEHPDLILLTPTCTSSILQEDLQNFVNRASLESKSDVLLADVNHYRVNELQAADRTLEQIVRFYIEKARKTETLDLTKTEKPSANIIGIFTLGFHNQHDCRELKRLLTDLGIEINEILPENGCVTNLKNLPKAWFNLIPYREVGLMAAKYLEAEFGMPYVDTTPMGIVETGNCIKEIEKILESQYALQKNYTQYVQQQTRYVSQAAWFSRSIDCQNLTGKRVVVFGDNTHAAAMTKILSREMGIRVACAGTYCKHDADWFREQVQGFCDEILITEDHNEVADMIARIEPSAIFGTQMERHVGKRLDIPCGVISSPVHIQNFPLGYRPFLGYEGTNQIADLVYNSFTLGMEDHLLEIFGGHDTKEVITKALSTDNDLTWSSDGLGELQKIPGFVRGKIKRNTERYARENGIEIITTDVMYAAKEAVAA